MLMLLQQHDKKTNSLYVKICLALNFHSEITLKYISVIPKKKSQSIPSSCYLWLFHFIMQIATLHCKVKVLHKICF